MQLTLKYSKKCLRMMRKSSKRTISAYMEIKRYSYGITEMPEENKAELCLCGSMNLLKK